MSDPPKNSEALEPTSTLENALRRATINLETPIVKDHEVLQRIERVCRSTSNRACARLLLACLLAKIHRPDVDIRKPYTEIGDNDTFSGRSYDERYITHFVNVNQLPLNSTTAFLTPAFRNLNQPLTTDLDLVGRPRTLYRTTLQLLDDVHTGKVNPEDMLSEMVRVLLVLREEKKRRIQELLRARQSDEDRLPLSSEEIVTLVEQHLRCKNSSRLPVLVVAAAYESVSEKLGERILPLQSHNAADEQTGALGDVEVCLENEYQIVTVYEMKTRRVTIDDVDRALEKIASADNRIHNYIFITTDSIDEEVKKYASGCYEKTGGIEIAILDCIGFLRHFLHLFHRSRLKFLDIYERFVLNEPDSAVNQALKEAFIALRNAAEMDRTDTTSGEMA